MWVLLYWYKRPVLGLFEIVCVVVVVALLAVVVPEKLEAKVPTEMAPAYVSWLWPVMMVMDEVSSLVLGVQLPLWLPSDCVVHWMDTHKRMLDSLSCWVPSLLPLVHFLAAPHRSVLEVVAMAPVTDPVAK
jgi:hypothetical protein